MRNYFSKNVNIEYYLLGGACQFWKNAGYRVGSVKELIFVIIPHFIKYPLLSTKSCTFTL
jgi:hypothetical protein